MPSTTCAGPAGIPVQLLRGVDQPRPGQFRVRLTFKGLGTHCEVLPSAEAANLRILQLRELRSAGLVPDDGPRDLTLGEAAHELLQEKLGAISRKTGRELSAGGIEFWRRTLRPWISGPHAGVPLHLLPARRMAEEIRQRCASTPKSGRDELAALKAVLRHARAAGAAVPERLLELQPPARRSKRQRRALTIEQLDLLAASAPPAYRRLILLQGSVGNRISELLLARPEHVDLAAGTLLVPNPKEGRPKLIALLPEEVELFAEQLGALRPATASQTAAVPSTPRGAEVIWPMPDGRTWPLVAGRVANAYYARAFWQPALAAASASWAELHPGEADPFAGLTTHDLRATAITAMRDLGISEETCARRVGHADAGGLVRRIYDAGDRDARAARELRQLAGRGILESARAAAAPLPHEARAAAPQKGTS